ncbi:MAG: primosomal protein N' [Ardenticatenaceae bacterium]|nr:primosomal protein N' [Ardenticatenaceae bacterium]
MSDYPYAELAINVEVPLENTFHYFVPADLRPRLQPGHLVEVAFGPRLAQGIVLRLDTSAPVEDTKPIISLVDPRPVLQPWQLNLAAWLSEKYLAPLNACLRLMLPPGLTRWADFTLALSPAWKGTGRVTDLQRAIIDLVENRGDLRGRQLERALKKAAQASGQKPPAKSKWQSAVNQLVRRDILIKGSLLDPPRIRPQTIRYAELIGGPAAILAAANQLGRANKQADILYYLVHNPDPLPKLAEVLAASGGQDKHLAALAAEGLVAITTAECIVTPAGTWNNAPANLQAWRGQLPTTSHRLPAAILASLQAAHLVELIETPATVSLAVPPRIATNHIFRLRQGTTYQQILQMLADAAQPVSLSEIYASTSANLKHLRKLEKLELIRFGAQAVWRDPLADRDFVPASAPTLTHDQARVWGRVKLAMLGISEDATDTETMADLEDEPAPAPPRPVMLHGVTGSGKTEIYMRAIEFALQQGQQAVVLVPEIALTPQTVRRFAARFPGRVAILHSRLTDGERYDTWRRARQGLFDIVVGPRSALFTPFANPGVIIVDEEHDNSYKQTPPVPPPYYHARDTAIALGQQTGAMVIMGSATPDLVTYHHARAGRYQLLELPKRVMGHRQRIESQASRLHVTPRYRQDAGDPQDSLTIPLPPVQIVDLRQELRAGNRSVFSRALQTALTETLARQEQAILFLNRRGTATFILCRDCGHVLRCPRCDVPLTYHRPRMMLTCHHCGRREAPHQECPNCGSRRIKYFGLGTEELEELVQQQWPEARIVRWDRDTTAGRDTHEQLLASFINQEADVLVGTQMIAKGLDLPLVTLVGVISADVSLGLPDMQTGERTFQVLTQVAGRAGRGLLGGQVIIQTYQPEHYAIQAAAEHDYTSFYLEEIRFRTRHNLPPFRRLARLLISDPVNERAQRAAEEMTRALRLHIREKALGATELLGPTPPFFSRIDGRYRWQIILRSPDPNRLLAGFSIPRPWIVDIDPVSTL